MKTQEEDVSESSVVDYSTLIESLQRETYEISRDTNTEGTLYGSIRKSDIMEMIRSKLATDTELSERQITLETPITKTGEHKVTIEFDKDSNATISLNVLSSSSSSSSQS